LVGEDEIAGGVGDGFFSRVFGVGVGGVPVEDVAERGVSPRVGEVGDEADGVAVEGEADAHVHGAVQDVERISILTRGSMLEGVAVRWWMRSVVVRARGGHRT
jgi:hypothetical protein